MEYRLSKRRSASLFVAIGLGPALALSLLLHIFPVFQGIYISFFQWSGLSQRKIFTGFGNYLRLLSDQIVWQSLSHDLTIVAVKIVVTMSLALLFSGMLFLGFRRGTKLFQGIIFFPNILSISIVAIIFEFIYNPSVGILNGLLRLVGLNSLTHAWIGDPGTALASVIFATVWASVGYQMIIIGAGMSNIPRSLLEMAEMEGAGKIRQFFTIVIPLMKNVLKTCFSLMVINTLNDTFVFIRILTKGGPNHGTEVLGTYMYFQAFDNFKFGYGTSVAVVNFLLALVLTALLSRLMKQEAVEYA
ncbi:MAG TPA: sugar ABC transporter permease [Spirochaetia bacterium]|nr:sugar ABC transporter permease [Spirochaetia bacterium]